MKITGTITCYDRPDQCEILTAFGQDADVLCLDNSDQFDAFGFSIRKTLWSSTDTTFVQSSVLSSPSPLSLTLLDRRYQGWTLSDTTYIDGTYTEPRFYDPLWISYGVYKNSSDRSSWTLQGYRFREALNPDVGRYFANMVIPADVGNYRVEWLYKKDQYSDVTAVNQVFSVTYWGNDKSSGNIWWTTGDSTVPSDNSSAGYNEIFGEWIGNNWGIRWPQYLW